VVQERFRLPDVGEGLTEAEIVAWRVVPGDVVAVNDVLVEVETAKAAVELPSPFAGTVAALLVEPGVPVPVGTPIIAIETAEASAGGAGGSPRGGPAPDRVEQGHPAAVGTPSDAGPDGRIPTLVGYGPRPGAARRRPRHTAPVAPAPTASGRLQQGGPAPDRLEQGHPAAEPAPSGRHSAAPAVGALVPLAKPPVRKLARDLGVDLRTVAGTGPGGVVTREDVRTAVGATVGPAAGGTGTAAPDDPTGGRDDRAGGSTSPRRWRCATGCGPPAPTPTSR
jgi:2-oxoisovalerate dehydrogenase E2 component (dihydrolipoyl transacylase)